MAMLFGSALVLLFYSELFFLNVAAANEERPLIAELGDFLAFAVEMTLWYTIFTAWFTLSVAQFKASSFRSVFLAGCLFGWATEGILVPEMYSSLPGSLIWPSVGWHVLVVILLGWWLVRRVLLMNRASLTALLAVGLGLFWGIWATWFWVDGTYDRLSPTQFGLFSFRATLLCTLGYVLIDRYGGTTYQPSRLEIWFFVAVSVLLWALMMYPLTPLQLALPVVAGIVLHALSRNRLLENGADLFSHFSGQTALWNYPLLFLMPATASLTYPIYFALDIHLPPAIVAIPLIIVGTIVLITSLVQIYWRVWRLRTRN
ncbi:hypothetical protein CKO40_01095 [Halochromatium glycolicum]|uniref:Uncharacterized protein n=2 Tax=Halochromatium glycolicum TaxID=85075 RepID=A0AAJ0U0L8_9GAMM|nr:hypothetical protein [Halochromatium glycolicum]